jgi:hypothetical protein
LQKQELLKRKSLFRRNLNNPEEIEKFLLEERHFLTEHFRRIVADLSDDMFELVAKLSLLSEEGILDLSEGLIIAYQ